MEKNDNALTGYPKSKAPFTQKGKKKQAAQQKDGPLKKPTMTQMPGRNSYEKAQQRRERDAGL